eukprot:bmy_15442T0
MSRALMAYFGGFTSQALNKSWQVLSLLFSEAPPPPKNSETIFPDVEVPFCQIPGQGKTKPGNSRNQGTIGNPKIMRKDLGDWQSAGERNKSWMEWGEEQSLEMQHVVKSQHIRAEKGSHKVSLSCWYHDRGWAKISNMTFSNGKLIVNQDGFYYLYANICFRHHETSGNLTANYLQLMVYVTKTSIKIPSSHTLMKGGSTKYWSGNSEFHFYSINVGGFFKLRSGEKISIEVSNPSLLDPDQDATYFGAFKVRDID